MSGKKEQTQDEIDALEMSNKGKLMLVTGSPITTKQILTMFQRTPQKHVHTRPAKGGGTWDYVTATYVKKVLNYVFGWLWSFEIVSEKESGNQVVVRGRLTILNPKTLEPMLVKEQYGRADIKKAKTGGTLDLGNDYKAAASDALKKCAAELGIASDIYGKQEFKEIDPNFGNKPQVPSGGDQAKGIQPETEQIMKVAQEMGAKAGPTMVAFVARMTGEKLTDWRMTSAQAKSVLHKILVAKLAKKK